MNTDNVLTAVLLRILANAMPVLRSASKMPRLVTREYETAAQRPGNAVNIEIPGSTTVEDVTPSNVGPNPDGSTPTVATISIDQWKKNKPFGITDKEMTEIQSRENYLPAKAEAAIAELTREQNRIIFGKYKKVYGYHGTAGTTPFGGTKATDAAQLDRVLNDQLCPVAERVLVMDPAAKAAANINDQMSDYDKVGTGEAHISGDMGERQGFQCYMDQDVPYHTAGTDDGNTLAAAAGSIGDTSIACDTGSGTMVEGDIITFDNHDQTYVVTADVADVSSGTISFSPPLVAAVPDTTAIAVKASHRVNLGFRKEAFAYVTVAMESRANMVQIQDPLTGIILRLEELEQYKQKVYEMDILSGAECIRPECAARLAG